MTEVDNNSIVVQTVSNQDHQSMVENQVYGVEQQVRPRLKKSAKFPWNMVKNCVNNEIFFYTFSEEKYQNILLNDKFPLKITNTTLLKQFPGNEMTG